MTGPIDDNNLNSFMSKTQKILEGKWSAFSGKDYLVVRFGSFFPKSRWRERAILLKTEALRKLISDTTHNLQGADLKQATIDLQGFVRETAAVTGSIFSRIHGGVAEEFSMQSGLEEFNGKMDSIVKDVFALKNQDLVSVTADPGSIKIEGDTAIIHMSKAGHVAKRQLEKGEMSEQQEGGAGKWARAAAALENRVATNEDGFSVSDTSRAVADGVSSGREWSGRLARTLSKIDSESRSYLQRTGKLGRMTAEEIQQFVNATKIKAISKVAEFLGIGPNKLIEHPYLTSASATQVGVTQQSVGKDKVRLVGGGNGDCSISTIDFSKKKARLIYQGERKLHAKEKELLRTDKESDSGGEFHAFSFDEHSIPKSDPFIDPSSQKTFDTKVKKGTMCILASDGLYDNLPGPDKNAALLAILSNPEFDHPKTREDDRVTLPPLEKIQANKPRPPISKEEAALRLRNYLDYAAPKYEDMLANAALTAESKKDDPAYIGKGDSADLGKGDDITFLIFIA